MGTAGRTTRRLSLDQAATSFRGTGLRRPAGPPAAPEPAADDLLDPADPARRATRSTDIGSAARFTCRHAGRPRLFHEWGKWLYRTGTGGGGLTPAVLLIYAQAEPDVEAAERQFCPLRGARRN